MKFTAALALFAVASAIKLREDAPATAGGSGDGPQAPEGAMEAIMSIDTDGNEMISLPEGLAGLASLGVQQPALDMIEGVIKQGHAEPDGTVGEISPDDLMDFAMMLGMDYCSQDPMPEACDGIEDMSIEDALSEIPFSELTPEDVLHMAANMGSDSSGSDGEDEE